MADVFISYASEDRDRVRPLADALQGRGFSIWWDRALGAGQDYSAIIEKELQDAKAVVVVWTAGSAASTFVRDEAGRARDEGRLIPVLLDRVQIPLGFGAFQAEDFTRWNGQRSAAQVQLLEESIKSKLEGRSIDGAAVARKRRRLGARIRIVSLLTVVALVVAIAWGLNDIVKPDPPPVDLRAELLRLLAEGQLTPEQAIQLAQILEAGALGETQSASAEGPSAAAPAPSLGASDRSASGPMSMEATDGVTGAVVTEAAFDASVRDTYRQAFLAVAQHPDAAVRTAAAQMSDETTRDAAMQTLWQYAQSHPDDELRDEIYLLCGSVGESNANPLGQQALEIAANLRPQEAQVWTMLSRSYRRTGDARDAQGAALVSSAVEAQAAGQSEVAEQRLQEALPNLSVASNRAIVASELGAVAERRQDWSAASARFSEAYRLREQAAQSAPSSPAVANLEQDAQRLVVALDRSGRTREACERLQQAQDEHAVDAPDAALAERCQNQFRMRVRPGVLSPETRPQLQMRQQQQVAPQAVPEAAKQ